jgi:hypothetical protein
MATTPQFYTSCLVGTAQRLYTNGMQSFVVTLTDFTGNLRIDATLCSQPDDSPSSNIWFMVSSKSYTTFTGVDTLPVQGWFVWIRMVVTVILHPWNQEIGVDEVQYIV